MSNVLQKLTKNKLYNYIMFFVGMFCHLSQLLPKIVVLFVLGIFGALLMSICKNLKFYKIKIGKGISWYGVFTIYVLFSLLYTVNKINPDYVILRMSTCLIIAIFVTQIVEFKDNFIYFIRGMAFGGIIGIVYVIIAQMDYIGVKRLGEGIYGSYAEFGNICMMTAISLIWILKENRKKNKFIIVLALLVSVLGIILSGARKAIITPIMFFILVELLDKRKKVSNKFIFFSIFTCCAIGFIYATLNIRFLYNAIGYRIDSGISSVLGNEKTDGSLDERKLYKDIAKDMIKEKPITGWGIHGFAYINYLNTGNLVYSHDTFYEILACYGIIGFILYFRIYFQIFMRYKNFLKTDENNSIGLFLISMSVIILVMEPFSISYLSLANVVLLACSAQYGIEVKRNEERL